jgi:hypothetical protein
VVLTTGWARSHVFQDELWISLGESGVSLLSVQGQLAYVHRTQFAETGVETDKSMSPSRFTSTDITAYSEIDLIDGSGELDTATSQQAFLGCRYGCGVIPILTMGGEVVYGTRFTFCIIPYCLLVLPLALLSAWLLLIKPRPAKSAKESSRA